MKFQVAQNDLMGQRLLASKIMIIKIFWLYVNFSNVEVFYAQLLTSQLYLEGHWRSKDQVKFIICPLVSRDCLPFC